MPKFIKFEEGKTLNGHPSHDVLNKKSGSSLARVLYYPPWKRFTCQFREDSVWSSDCLADIQKFLEEVNKE
jgi:hypothetical protein